MMANFISKSFSKPKENDNNSVKQRDTEVSVNVDDKNDEILEESAVEEKMEVDDQSNGKDEEIIVKNDEEKAAKTKEDTKQSNKSRKRKSQSKNSQSSKRRKRIIEQHNSDSDSKFYISFSL